MSKLERKIGNIGINALFDKKNEKEKNKSHLFTFTYKDLMVSSTEYNM